MMIPVWLVVLITVPFWMPFLIIGLLFLSWAFAGVVLSVVEFWESAWGPPTLGKP